MSAESPAEEAVDTPTQAEPAEGGEEPYEPSFFVELDQVKEILTALGKQCPAAYYQVIQDAEVSKLFTLFEDILCKYQEFPTLIKRHLAQLISPLVELMLARLPSGEEISQKLMEIEKLKGESQQQKPEFLLGQNYDEYDSDAEKSTLHHICRALYIVAKVSGHKSCTSHFPHEVRYMEHVVYCLQYWQQDPKIKREWEVRYCLLLWLANLILVPFALHTIDSAYAGKSLSQQVLHCAMEFLGDASRCRDGSALLIGRMMTRPDAKPLRDEFFEFALNAVGKLSYATEAQAHVNHFLVGGVLLAISITLKLGKRQELVPMAQQLIPKLCPTALSFPDVLLCKTAVKTVQRLGLACLPQRAMKWKYSRTFLKLEENLANSAAPSKQKGDQPKPIHDDEQEENFAVPGLIEDVLDILLQALSHTDTIVRWSAAKGIGRICDRLPKVAANEVVTAVVTNGFEVKEDDAGWHGACLAVAELCRRSILLPSRFIDVIPVVSSALMYDVSKGSYSVGAHVRDAACYVCWSIARAYDPKDLLAYVFQISSSLVIASLFDREVNVRRAAAAAFQECVGRLGNFPHGIDLVTTMDFFSLATMRNAFLLVAPKVAEYETYRLPLADHVLETTVNHWDRRVRRNAATALGVLASILPKEYVLKEILTSLLERSFDPLPSLRHGNIFALAEVIGHCPADYWDEKTIASFISIPAKLDSKRLFRGGGGEYIRQGCCFLVERIASVALKLPNTISVGDSMRQDVSKQARTNGKIQEFLDDCLKQPIEWLQEDAARALQAFSSQYYTSYTSAFHGKIIQKLLAGVDETKSPNERRGSLLALGCLTVPLLEAQDPTIGTARQIPLKKEEGAATTTTEQHDGESIPPTDSQPVIAFNNCSVVLRTLCRCTQLETNKDAQDAEARRNAVRSLVNCITSLVPTQEGAEEGGNVSSLGDSADTLLPPQPVTNLMSSVLRYVFHYLTLAMDDYAVDKRGDVGSFVRMESLQGMMRVLKHCIESALLTAQSPSMWFLSYLYTFLCCTLKQAVEKIDRMRGIAGGIFSEFLIYISQLENRCVATDGEQKNAPDSSSSFHKNNLFVMVKNAIPEYDQLLSIAEIQDGKLDWSNPSETFEPIVVPLLRTSPYRQCILEGLVVSVGGLSMHVLKASLHALLLAAAENKDQDATSTAEKIFDNKKVITEALIQVTQKYEHNERVVVPVYTTIDKLIVGHGFHADSLQTVVKLLASEIKYFSKQIQTLLPLVATLATLCQVPYAKARQDAWALALTLIASRFPKVRAKMGMELHTALLAVQVSHPEEQPSSSSQANDKVGLVVNFDAALEKLLITQWDGTNAVAVRNARDALYTLLGLVKPDKDTSDGGVTSKTGTKGDDGTYKSLMREAGY